MADFGLYNEEKNENLSDLQTSEECENDLKINYNTPGHPIAYSGVINIYNFYNKLLSVEKIKEILSSIESYTLHRGYRSSQRNPSFSHFKRQHFQMDLIDIQQKAEANDGVKYLLAVIDTFTRYAFVRTLGDKTGKNVLNAFKNILAEAGQKPLHITMDRG